MVRSPLDALVTAGPTWEPLDAVRVLSNRSTGKMGYAIAAAGAADGHRITLISGPTELAPPAGVERIGVETALDMRAAVASRWRTCDLVVMVAAVSDFRPARRIPGKLHRARPDVPAEALCIELVANPDILAELGEARAQSGAKRPLLVGFAAEAAGTQAELVEAAGRKLLAKQCDLLVANDVLEPGAGFGVDTNRVRLFEKPGREGEGARTLAEIGPASKAEVAAVLWRHFLKAVIHG